MRPAFDHALVGGPLVRAVHPVPAQLAELEQDRDLAVGVRRADGRQLALEHDRELAPPVRGAQDPQEILLARLVVQRVLRDDQHPGRRVDITELVLVELGELGRVLGLLGAGGRQLELAAPHLGELGPIGDLAERLGEDREVLRGLRCAAERAGELVPQAQGARRALDPLERFGLIGLDAEHVEVRRDHGLGLAIELGQELRELLLQLHPAGERRLARRARRAISSARSSRPAWWWSRACSRSASG